MLLRYDMIMLISTEELHQILNDNNTLIVDSRAHKEYSQGHIPGAVNLDLFAFHWIDTSEEGIISFNEQMRKILSYAGIDETKKVVFYDNISGMLAARGVWLCLYFSHPNVFMLNGGLKTWITEKFEIETKSNAYKPTNLTTPINTSILVGAQYVEKSIGKSIIIDARSPEEFDGRITRAARIGHIPSAINLDWTENVDETGQFKPDEELSRTYQFNKESEVITYCQGAYRAANSFLAIKKLGFKNVKVYLGSWGEWGNRLDLPVEN